MRVSSNRPPFCSILLSQVNEGVLPAGPVRELLISMRVVPDEVRGATIDRHPTAARVINKVNLPEFIPEMGIDTRILSIVIFPAVFTRLRELST